MPCRQLLCLASLIALFLFVAQGQSHGQLSDHPNLIQSFGALPMGFEQNQGQAEDNIRFLSRGAGYSVYLSRGEMLLAFDSRNKASAKPELVHISLANADQKVEPQGTDLLPGISNYYIGNDPAKWHTGVRQFRKVVYHGVYPGIDLFFYGNHRQLEFDFGVAPGVDPSRIGLRVDGASIRKTKEDLELITPSGKVALLKKPELYQGDGKTRHRVLGGYHLRSASEVAFRVGKYDTRQALVIDPALIYSTLFGAAINNNAPFSIAVDANGAAYLTGQTFSPNPLPNAFVLKFDPTGSALLYQTLIGGTIERIGPFCSNCVTPNTPAASFGIAVDASGNAYTAGMTDELDFPVTAGSFSTNSFCVGNNGNIGCMEPFAAKLDPNGKLVFSTFLVSASATDTAGPVPSSIAIDSSGAMYVTGTTAQQISNSFPVSVLPVGGLSTPPELFKPPGTPTIIPPLLS